MTRVVCFAIWSMLLVSPASAQQPIASSFGELKGRIRLDERLFITDTRGTTIEGRFLTLGRSTIDVRLGRNDATPPLRLSESDVNNIYVVRRDRWWDGPLIGFAIGVGTAAIIEAANRGDNGKFQGGSLVGFGNLCALIGFTFDIFNKDKVTVYVQSPRPRI